MSDIAQISSTYTKLIVNTDQSRLNFSNTALTIYTAFSSGLFLLSTSLVITNTFEKVAFLTVFITGVLIVLLSLVERYAYFLIANNIGEFYTKHVRKTGEHYSGQMGGTPFQSILASIPIHLVMVLIFVNLVASIAFVFSSF